MQRRSLGPAIFRREEPRHSNSNGTNGTNGTNRTNGTNGTTYYIQQQ
ncbi:MAG: hypothetical protein P8N51_12410 [Pseudomonadales bacterium]|nr:hypothetical protein [Pseudomonadales bacterium]